MVLISAKSGAVDRSFPDANGSPNVVLADGHGGWFAAGTFTCVGDVVRRGVAHLHADGRVDLGWKATVPVGPETDPLPVNALALVGSTLYVGGADFVAAVDAGTGAHRWLTRFSGESHVGYPVAALAANTERVFVGGAFTRVDGMPHRSLVVLSPKTGAVLRWNTPRLRSTAAFPLVPVGSLALDHGRLFFGAPMTEVNGEHRFALAALDARTGSLTPWSVPDAVDDDTGQMLVADNRVFLNGHDSDPIVSEQTGAVDPRMNTIQAPTYAVSGDTLYLGFGCRTTSESIAGHLRHNLAAVSIPSGRLAGWAPPKIANYPCVSAMAANSSQVLVVGGFSKTLG